MQSDGGAAEEVPAGDERNAREKSRSGRAPSQHVRNMFHDFMESKLHLLRVFFFSIKSLKAEIVELKSFHSKHESQRAELANRLQALMTSHCNQALQLLHSGAGDFDFQVQRKKIVTYMYVQV